MEKIASIDGVDAATRYLSVNLEIKGEDKKSLALDVSENYTVSTFTLTDGAAYDDKRDGIWLSDKFADLNNIKIGDTLTLVFQGMEINGRVVGLIKVGEHMICLADSNQMMPDFNIFGYAYISPAKLNAVIREKTLNNVKDELKKAGLPDDMIDEQAIYDSTLDMITDSWEKRNASYDITSQKRSDATLGYERVYDTETGEVYRAYNGFTDDYSGSRYKSVTDEMYTKTLSGYIEKRKQAKNGVKLQKTKIIS